ncbi:MAG: hypothetical protein ACQGVK_24340 [Myxococcota bacterium]
MRIGLAGVAWLALALAPGAAFARGESWVITGVESDGCGNGESSFEITTVYPDGGDFFQNTMVFVGVEVYMDEVVDMAGAITDADTWGIFGSNDRGRLTHSMPLPEDTVLRMTNEIKDEDGDIIWESSIIVDECNDPDISFNVHGPASQRLANKGFEKAGGSAKKAKKWGGDSEGVSKRICPEESPLVFEGECAMQFKPASNAKGSLSQTVSPDLVEENDVIRLSAMVAAEGLEGGGKLKATVKYEGGGKGKISIDIPEGEYDYTWLADDVVVTGEVSEVSVSIQTNKGTGRFYVDDIMLTEIANGLPLPDAQPMPF